MDDRSSVCVVLDLLDLEDEGDPGRDGELEIHGLRAKCTSLPDIERALDGRAAGSGGRVSGTLTGTFCVSGSAALSLLDASSCDVSR